MMTAAVDYEGITDQGLAALAGQGDRLAFRGIMKRCNQRLFRIARAVVGGDDEAEDVLQAAYLSAFAKIAQFRGDSSLLTWLAAITLNEARGRLRQRRPTLEFSMLDHIADRIVPFPGAVDTADPEAEAGRAQIRVLLEDAIDSLSSDFRIVFILREIEGCSIEDTATQLGIPQATVKTRLFRARRQLRRALERQFVAGLDTVFPFLGARCDRICEKVLDRLGGELG
jgi:RNA polymerase sigma-70 factor (ECF subfamily)